MSTSRYMNCARDPMANNCWPSRSPKNDLRAGTQLRRGVRKMAVKRPKKPSPATPNRHTSCPTPPPSQLENPLWETDVMETVVPLCTDSGVRGGVGRPSPKGGDARRTSPPGGYSVGSATHHWTRWVVVVVVVVE